MRYIPSPALDDLNDEQALREYLQREYERISDATRFPVVHHIQVEKIQSEPAKPSDGMVAYADGTNWDPGCGGGFYRYDLDSAMWKFLEVKTTTGGGGEGFGIIVVSGQDNVVAEVATDTLTLVADTKITLVTDASTDTVTIQAIGFVDPNVTTTLNVGYTTAIDSQSFTNPFVPVFTSTHQKLLTVTSSFTLNEPTTNSHCEYYVTITGAGGYTVTAGTGVKVVGSFPSLAFGTDYALNVRRYGSGKTIAQIVALT